MANEPYGMLGYVGIAKETTWGTAVAAASYFEALSEGVDTSIDRFETRNLVGNIYEADDEDGLRRHAGELVTAANPENMGHLLRGALGVTSTNLIVAGLNRNIFSIGNTDAGSLNALPGYTLELARGGIGSAMRYAGANFSTLTLGTAINQDVRLTAGVIAKARTLLARTTPTFPGSPLAPFTFKTSSLQLYGAAAENVQAVTLALNNQLEGVSFLNGTTEINAIRRNAAPQFRVSGTTEYRNNDEVQRFINQTEFAFTGYWTLAASFSLLVETPRLVFTAHPVVSRGRERITVDWQAMARYHVGSGAAARVTLTSISSYG